MRQASRATACALVVAAAVQSGGAVANAQQQDQQRRGQRALTFQSIEEFDPALQEIPESVTTDEAGNLYVSVGNTIRQRSVDGQISVLGTLPLPVFALGVKVGPDGCVYTVSTSLAEDVEGAFVWRICEPGSVEAVAALDPTGGPNDLAFGRNGSLFVTDPVLGQIWQVSAEGEASVLLQHPLLEGDPNDPALLFRPLGVNGIAVGPNNRTLYVSNTDQGSVLRVSPNSPNPTAEVFVQDARLRGADGIAFDRAGRLLVTVNASDTLLAVTRQRRIVELAEGGLLDSPSSVVFGATRADRQTLYLASSAFSRILGLKPGSPQPALLAARIRTPGLPLP